MRLETSGTGAPRFRFDVSDADWEQWVLVTSDVHFDSVHCDRELLFKHLGEAKERGALWWDLGDFWDVMQGRNDRRRDRGGLRPEYHQRLAEESEKGRGAGLWQVILEDAEERLQPYLSMLRLAGLGNHELAVMKHSDFSMTQDLVSMAERAGSGGTHYHGYTGYAQVMMRAYGAHSALNVFLTHGYGGGGPVNQGTQQDQRRLVYARDADLIVSGHVHEMRMNRWESYRINTHGNEELVPRWSVVTPGYKQEFPLSRHPRSGFHLSRGAPPKPVGALWVRLSLRPQRKAGVKGRGRRFLAYELRWAQ